MATGKTKTEQLKLLQAIEKHLSVIAGGVAALAKDRKLKVEIENFDEMKRADD